MIVASPGAVTAADSISIAWRSSSSTVRAAPGPGELPDASDRCAQSTAAVPVVVGGASAPPNESTCAAVPLPDRAVTLRAGSSTALSVMPVYADSDEALTGSL